MLRDPYQTDEWAKLKGEHGYRTLRSGNTYIYVKDILVGRFVDIQYPNDPQATMDEALEEIGPSFVQLLNDPQYSGHVFTPRGREHRKTSFKVALDRSVTQLWENLKKQNRNAIRQAERKGCEFRVGTVADDFEQFYDIYHKVAESKGFVPLSRRIIHRVFRSPLSKTYVVSVHDKPASVAMVLHSDSVARFWYGAGSPQFYEFRPSNFLHWNIMLAAKSRGCLYYDLDVASPESIFKPSFGAQSYPQQSMVWGSATGRLIKRLTSILR
jgi:hypothetical protein